MLTRSAILRKLKYMWQVQISALINLTDSRAIHSVLLWLFYSRTSLIPNQTLKSFK